jgi:hypothetical protein
MPSSTYTRSSAVSSTEPLSFLARVNQNQDQTEHHQSSSSALRSLVSKAHNSEQHAALIRQSGITLLSDSPLPDLSTKVHINNYKLVTEDEALSQLLLSDLKRRWQKLHVQTNAKLERQSTSSNVYVPPTIKELVSLHFPFPVVHHILKIVNESIRHTSDQYELRSFGHFLKGFICRASPGIATTGVSDHIHNTRVYHVFKAALGLPKSMLEDIDYDFDVKTQQSVNQVNDTLIRMFHDARSIVRTEEQPTCVLPHIRVRDSTPSSFAAGMLLADIGATVQSDASESSNEVNLAHAATLDGFITFSILHMHTQTVDAHLALGLNDTIVGHWPADTNMTIAQRSKQRGIRMVGRYSSAAKSSSSTSATDSKTPECVSAAVTSSHADIHVVSIHRSTTDTEHILDSVTPKSHLGLFCFEQAPSSLKPQQQQQQQKQKQAQTLAQKHKQKQKQKQTQKHTQLQQHSVVQEPPRSRRRLNTEPPPDPGNDELGSFIASHCYPVTEPQHTKTLEWDASCMFRFTCDTASMLLRHGSSASIGQDLLQHWCSRHKDVLIDFTSPFVYTDVQTDAKYSASVQQVGIVAHAQYHYLAASPNGFLRLAHQEGVAVLLVYADPLNTFVQMCQVTFGDNEFQQLRAYNAAVERSIFELNILHSATVADVDYVVVVYEPGRAAQVTVPKSLRDRHIAHIRQHGFQYVRALYHSSGRARATPKWQYLEQVFGENILQTTDTHPFGHRIRMAAAMCRLRLESKTVLPRISSIRHISETLVRSLTHHLPCAMPVPQLLESLFSHTPPELLSPVRWDTSVLAREIVIQLHNCWRHYVISASLPQLLSVQSLAEAQQVLSAQCSFTRFLARVLSIANLGACWQTPSAASASASASVNSSSSSSSSSSKTQDTKNGVINKSVSFSHWSHVPRRNGRKRIDWANEETGRRIRLSSHANYGDGINQRPHSCVVCIAPRKSWQPDRKTKVPPNRTGICALCANTITTFCPGCSVISEASFASEAAKGVQNNMSGETTWTTSRKHFESTVYLCRKPRLPSSDALSCYEIWHSAHKLSSNRQDYRGSSKQEVGSGSAEK